MNKQKAEAFTIQTPLGGWVRVSEEDEGSTKDVYVEAASHGASLSLADVRDLIMALTKTAGFQTTPTGDNMGVIIQFPESEDVETRREELAQKFNGLDYGSCNLEMQHAIEFIIKGEIERGELR